MKLNSEHPPTAAYQPAASPPAAATGNAPPAPQLTAEARAIDLFAQPLSWQQIVPGGRAVELEIGSGKGLFLLSAAAARPEHWFVGIELAAKFAHGAAQRLARRGLGNVQMLRGDARSFLAGIVPDCSVVAVHVYFPDPWWRNKHKKRRVLNEQTLQAIERILTPGGQLHFWTDVLDYYEHICGEIMDGTNLSGPAYVPQRSATHAMDYTTHFERRARTHGQPVYRAIFQKPASIPGQLQSAAVTENESAGER